MGGSSHLEGSTLGPKDQLLDTHNLTFSPDHVDLCENLQHRSLFHQEFLQLLLCGDNGGGRSQT